MPEEPTDRDALQNLTEQLAALRTELPESDYEVLVRNLSAWTLLLTSSASQVTWLGTFQPGAQPAETADPIKIGTAPPPPGPGTAPMQEPMQELLYALAGIFAALARMAGTPPPGPPVARKIKTQ